MLVEGFLLDLPVQVCEESYPLRSKNAHFMSVTLHFPHIFHLEKEERSWTDQTAGRKLKQKGQSWLGSFPWIVQPVYTLSWAWRCCESEKRFFLEMYSLEKGPRKPTDGARAGGADKNNGLRHMLLDNCQLDAYNRGGPENAITTPTDDVCMFTIMPGLLNNWYTLTIPSCNI